MSTQKNFVAPAPAVQQPQQPAMLAPVQPIGGKALVDSHNRLLDLYGQQVKQAASVTGEIVTDNDQRVSYRLSTASELAERRRTARMYLVFLGLVVGAVVTGIVTLAWLAGITSNAAQTIAIWLILFGSVQSWLTWRTLHREQTLSPEGLHERQIDLDATVHQMDAQTRRLAIQYAGRAELARVQLEADRVAAQREANNRLAMETQAQIASQMTRHTTPQDELNRLNTYRPQVEPVAALGPQDGLGTALDTGPIGYDLEPAAMPVEPITDTVRQRLLNFTADLYLDRDKATGEYKRMDANGMLKTGITVPWSQRGGMNKAERDAVEAILRQIQPALFTYDPTARRWFVNVKSYRSAGRAVAAIDGAYTFGK